MKRAVLIASLVALAPFVASAASCPGLVRGSHGPAVSAVQKILFATYTNFPAPTGYFGPTTEAAVKQWQSENEIEQTGTVGPKTAASMHVSLCSTNTNVATSLPATTPTVGLSNPNQALIDALLAQLKVLQARIAALLSPLQPLQTTSAEPRITQAVPESCPRVTPPACSTGTLSWKGNDQNGCSLGFECVQTSTAPCTFADRSIASGSSVTAYQTSSVEYGSACISQQRLCTSGTLSGGYQYASCTPAAPASCSFNGATVAHLGSITAYKDASVPYGSICQSEIRNCSNGTLSGSFGYSACSVGAAASCVWNNQSIQNGSTVTAYQSATVAYGGQCVSETRLCQNGVLMGSYQASSCSPAQPANCSFNGATVGHGSSVTAYQASSVPFGSQCVSQTRNCSNGTLSGTYQYGTCVAGQPANCTFNGATIESGASVTAYQSASVPAGSACAAEVRMCTNGMLSGTYQYATCAVQSGGGSIPSIAALRGLAPGSSASVTVQGYYAANDGGGGTFTWNATSQAKDDGGYVIAPTSAGASGRWMRTIVNNTLSPEMFGAKHDGVTNDAPAINAAVNALSGLAGGTVSLACNTTYNLSTPIPAPKVGPWTGGNEFAEIVPRSNVSITGCGTASVLRIANNINKSPVHYNAQDPASGQLFGSMVAAIFNITDTVSNAIYSNFTIDMNGQNNDCGGTCWTWSAVLGAWHASNVTVDNVTFLNNPGSNDIQFGDGTHPSLASNITIKNNHLSNGGNAVNPAAADYSAIWLTAVNSTITNNTLDHGSPPGNQYGSGAAIEIHGSNILATGNTITHYWSAANIGNLSGSSDGLKFNGNTVNDVSEGVLVWTQSAGSTQDHVEVSNNSITLNAGFPKDGIDLDEEAPYAGGGITITGNTIKAPYPNTGQAVWCGINIGQFRSVTITSNTIVNTPGPGICGKTILPGAAVYINGNTINNSGINNPGGDMKQSGVWMPASNNLPNWVSIKNNSIDTASFGIWGALNVGSGEISGNTIVHTTIPIQWTGTGIALGAATPDDQRKKDLQTLATALQSYYTNHGTYAVPGGGVGVVGKDGNPTVIQALASEGDLASNAPLPSNPVNANDFYMLYICDAGKTFALSAKLDTPTNADITKIQSSCNGTGANGTNSVYGRNYAVTGSNGVITP